ncbi:MFS transporter, CP family, cyanate transporter [Agreia bicolorata]|uniref:MFS transporter, CP family, cyanate transporter n=1 Tax=Agreia bicolorata TaxID=110935 RepID=A0A1T4XUE0_9MICO|nr:MFS transporter [Agreia bicolorata]SKA93182.1 MFS transporter, CP family, cyanate transporter [Agreia bicolorata]
MSTSPPPPNGASATAARAGGRALALVGIVLVAVNLRTAVAALSPIFTQISVDVPVDSVGVGLLGTLPPLCFAVFGLLAPVLKRHLRLETLLIAALCAILIGHLARGLAPNYAVLALASVLTFAGMGVANVVLPPVVKKYFPASIGTLTSMYVTIMALFSVIPPLVAVPIADSLGWRVSVSMWAALAAVAIIPWLTLWMRDRRATSAAARAATAAAAPAASESPFDAELLPEVSPTLVGQVWYSRLAWSMGLLFGATSLNVYAAFAWLPEILIDIAGVSPAQAGILLSLYAGMGIPFSLLVPILASRMRSVAPLIALGFVCFAAGYAGLLLAPAALPWLWVALVGAGPLTFPLVLVLVGLRSRTPEGTVALSGFTQGIGYALGALGPLVVGVLHELSGGWTAPLAFLLLTLAVVGLAGRVVARPRMLEDDWHRSSPNRAD